jgi:protoporphyrinogen oxidase
LISHDRTTNILIIGAGPTGLGAAYHLDRLGISDWMLLEASNHSGGLASSFVDSKGFTWDIGGHVQFSHYDYFDEAMLAFLGSDGWLQHRRESWVWIRNRFVPYPLQSNIHRLPDYEVQQCLQGLRELDNHPHDLPENFLHWIHRTFGRGLSDLFMEPYNSKVWVHPLEMMGYSWVGERVAVPNYADILQRINTPSDDVIWGPNRTFQFPKYGGTGAIWQACTRKLPSQNVVFGSKVKHIDLMNKKCIMQDGLVYRYEHLISTMPLTELIEASGQNQLQKTAEKGLLHSSSNIIGIGLNGKPSEGLSTKNWIYFPEDDCPFYRATIFSNYSPNNVPDAKKNWSLMLEVSESHFQPIEQAKLVESVIQGAINTNLIESREKIVSTWQYRADYGYPTPGIHRDKALSDIIPFFEAHHVYSRGRFGMWKYEVSNQDHSFMQGVEIIERLLNGNKEITAFDPNHANSKKHPWPFERWTT